MLPPGGEPGLGGLEGELGDDEDLAFGDAFDMPLAGLPEFFTSTDGTEPPEGGDVIAAQMEAAAEYDMLAEITGEESGARAALGLAPAASGAAVYAAPAPAAAPGGGDAGGWGNLGQLQAAYLQKWQQQQVRMGGDEMRLRWELVSTSRGCRRDIATSAFTTHPVPSNPINPTPVPPAGAPGGGRGARVRPGRRGRRRAGR